MKKMFLYLVLLLLGSIGQIEFATAGEANLVGTTVANDMRIEFYLSAPKADIVKPTNDPMAMNGLPTHHFEVRAFDVETGKFIPYLNVLLHFKNLSNNRLSMLSLSPMLGDWFHYGNNGALIEKGKYEVTVYVAPQDLLRYGQVRKKWMKSTIVSFNYDWKG